MTHRKQHLAKALKLHVDSLKTVGVSTVPRSIAKPKKVVSKEEELSRLRVSIGRCRRCSLHKTRTNIVVSDGTPHAKLVFVGEAPGFEEDRQGIPFVGKAGQLLTKMIEAIQLRREDVYICNVLKDRPPSNRTPTPQEMEACMPFLKRQLAIVQPEIICTLGSVATKAFFGQQIAITKIRGQLLQYDGIPVIPTFHPAYLLRNPPAKKYAWVDLKKVKQFLAQ